MTAISVLASAVTIAMFISQLSIVTQLRRAQRTRATVPMLQFLVSFLSSVLWLKYGLLKADPTIVFVNVLGTLISIYIMLCFWWYGNARLVETRFLLTLLCGLLAIAYVDNSSEPWAHDAFSMLCCLISLVFLGSPLGQIGSVVRLQDASVLLPSVALLAFFNNVLWSVYGHIHNDPFMLFPNAIGAALCALQLGLIAYYGRAAANLPLAAPGKLSPEYSDGVESVPMTEIAV
ncbi:sugar transmembrane transporter activity protein [Coemansia furcata]|nr:sugar transmembrane transporter activity protein [Coemansia furcata]